MNDDSAYYQWGANNREEYMHKKGGVKGTSLWTLELVLQNLDKVKGHHLDQLLGWADGEPGKNFGSNDSEEALRQIIPGMPPRPWAWRK